MTKQQEVDLAPRGYFKFSFGVHRRFLFHKEKRVENLSLNFSFNASAVFAWRRFLATYNYFVAHNFRLVLLWVKFLGAEPEVGSALIFLL